MASPPPHESAERREGQKAAMDEKIAETKEKYMRIYKERLAAKEKQAAEERAEADRIAASNDGREEGEILSQDSAVTANPSANSSQQPSDAGALLASFSPRKEPRKMPAPPSSVENPNGSMNDGKPAASREMPPKLDVNTVKSACPTTPSSKSGTLLTGSPKMKASDPSRIPAETASPAKRPAPSNAYGDERRKSVFNMAKIPKRTSAASPKSPDRSDGQQLRAAGNRGPPKWYLDTPVPTARAGDKAGTDILLQRLRTEVKKCKEMAPTSSLAFQTEKFGEVRNILQKLFFNEVSASLLKKNRMLHPEGLPQIFEQNNNIGFPFPWDISADAHELYIKWCRRVFDTDIFRGIKFGQTMSNKKDSSRNTDSIDPNYIGIVSAKYHGEGDLLNGQWWPTQLCALRDGAHGVSQGGISGKPGDGAFSCIMSGGHDYPDEDHGDIVLYCGTDSDNGELTTYTKLMKESVNNHPVRLIRSHNLDSAFAPIKGFRYDGLYNVVSAENLDREDSTRQRHRFRLVRQRGQDPIRGGIGPERRPTKQEVEQYNKHMRLSGKKKSVH